MCVYVCVCVCTSAVRMYAHFLLVCVHSACIIMCANYTHFTKDYLAGFQVLEKIIYDLTVVDISEIPDTP